MRNGSAMMSPTVSTGFSDEIGILEDVLHVPPQPPQLAERQARDLLAVEGMLPLLARIRPMIARPVVVLPQPDSPTSPRVSPA